MEELHRTHSNSSSSSNEEVEGGERKKIKDKISLPVEKCDDIGNAEARREERFLEKIKEKLPGQHKKTEEVTAKPPPESKADGHSPVGETKEKKGIMDKIKGKLPGSHKNGEQEKKEN